LNEACLLLQQLAVIVRYRANWIDPWCSKPKCRFCLDMVHIVWKSTSFSIV